MERIRVEHISRAIKLPPSASADEVINHIHEKVDKMASLGWTLSAYFNNYGHLFMTFYRHVAVENEDTMRGAGYTPERNQVTSDTYAVAAQIDGELTVTIISNINLDAKQAALMGYRHITKRGSDPYIDGSIFYPVPNFHPKDETNNKDNWHRFRVNDPVAGEQFIAVHLLESRGV